MFQQHLGCFSRSVQYRNVQWGIIVLIFYVRICAVFSNTSAVSADSPIAMCRGLRPSSFFALVCAVFQQHFGCFSRFGTCLQGPKAAILIFCVGICAVFQQHFSCLNRIDSRRNVQWGIAVHTLHVGICAVFQEHFDYLKLILAAPACSGVLCLLVSFIFSSPSCGRFSSPCNDFIVQGAVLFQRFVVYDSRIHCSRS